MPECEHYVDLLKSNCKICDSRKIEKLETQVRELSCDLAEAKQRIGNLKQPLKWRDSYIPNLFMESDIFMLMTTCDSLEEVRKNMPLGLDFDTTILDAVYKLMRHCNEFEGKLRALGKL